VVGVSVGVKWIWGIFCYPPWKIIIKIKQSCMLIQRKKEKKEKEEKREN